MSEPNPENPFAPPQSPSQPAPRGESADETVATIIPYKNPPALLSYYFGLFGVVLSCVPLFGLAACVAAVVLGIKGLALVRATPEAHGTGHAWFGIITGAIGTLIGLLSTIGTLIAIVAALNSGP
jgi:hypothetical protein